MSPPGSNPGPQGGRHASTLEKSHSNSVPRAQKVEDPSATGLLLRTYSAGPVVSDLLLCIRPKAGNALQPSITRPHNAGHVTNTSVAVCNSFIALRSKP
jgi:hypothetical protein